MKNKFFLIIILSAMSLFIGCETYSGDSYDFSNSKNGQYVDFLTKQSEKIKVGLEVKIPVEKRTSSSSSDITITLKLKGKKVDTTIIDTIKRLEKKVVFNYLVPKYVEIMMYGAIVESATCEHAARRMAMENATDNARDMLDTLSLNYNRARQAAITNEIIEIVSGSEAQK